MPLALSWIGPYTFSSRHGRSILGAPEADSGGIYVWGVKTPNGTLPHYVGETGSSFGKRHFEHFQAYVSGIYSTRDAAAFTGGNEVILHRGPLWKSDAWRAIQPFIDDFPNLAVHLERSMAAIQIYVAPLHADGRLRRRIETGLIRVFEGLPADARGLFGDSYRKVRRRPDETPVHVSFEGIPAIRGFPGGVEA